MSLPFTDNSPLLNSVTATTTSVGFDVSKRQQVTLQFVASGITSGNGVFSVDASNDGTNWITGIAFQDATATASNTLVTSKTLSSNTTAGAYVEPGWRYIRAKCTVTTDGTYSAIIEAAG